MVGLALRHVDFNNCLHMSILCVSGASGLLTQIGHGDNENVFCRLFKTDLYCRGWAGAPLSRFLEEAPYKFLNE